jgi:uncharacterized membrane protein YjjP (DUF1212 family)
MKRLYVRATQSNWKIFRWPLLVAVLSIAGLLSALMGDGWYDTASWLVLGTLVGFIVWVYRA